MDDENKFLGIIDAALRDEGTPRWAVPILLCIRDDHVRLREHLASHRRWTAPVGQILVGVATAVAVALTFWILSGRLPGILGP